MFCLFLKRQLKNKIILKTPLKYFFSTDANHTETVIAIPQAECLAFSDAGAAGLKCPLTHG